MKLPQAMFSVFDGRRQPLGSIFFKNVKMHKHKLHSNLMNDVSALVKELYSFS